VGSIIAMLREEIATPFDARGVPALESGLSLGEHLEVAYMYSLGELRVPEILWGRLKALDVHKDTPEEVKALQKRLLVAFAMAYNRSPSNTLADARLAATRELAQIIASDPYDFIRAYAARALGFLQAKDEAASALIRALDDTAFRDVTGLQGIGYPGQSSEVYLVRREAAMALKRMGYNVERTGENTWEVKDTAPR